MNNKELTIKSYDKDLIYKLSGDLSNSLTPYADLAEELGLDEEYILKTIEKWTTAKLIRRFGASLRHQKSGYQANAMVVWIISEDKIDEAGKIFADLPEVSHCYQREIVEIWPYNLYCMIHAKSSFEINNLILKMSAMIDNGNYRVLKSLTEFKKTSMRYFNE